MIDHDTWLGFGLNRKAVVPTTMAECVLGGYIYDMRNRNVDLKNTEYFELTFINNWIDMGIQNGWMTSIGCIEHELDRFNFILDLQGMIPLHPEISPKLYKSDNSDYSDYEVSNIDTAQNLLEAAQTLDPCKSILDVGCGRGEVLIWAAKAGYEDLAGFDYQPEIVEHALVENITVDNAETYLLPDKKVHIYMFNPFKNKILDKFIKNNIDNIKRNGSMFLYNNPITADHLFVLHGFKSIAISGTSRLYKLP